MAVKLTPEQFVDKHARRLKASLDDIRAGIQRVTDAPGAAAAKKKDKWQAALSKPETADKWARRVASVSVEDWKAAMTNKGISRIAAGIDAAAPKVLDFASKLTVYQNNGLAQIQKMPDLTLEDSINRMGAWARYMSNFKR